MRLFQKRVFSARELFKVKHGSLTYYMACELRKMQAPIEFSVFNTDLEPEDIKINGQLKDRIKMDGSHEFVFTPLWEESDGEV